MNSLIRRVDNRGGDRLRRKLKGKGEPPIKGAPPWESRYLGKPIYIPPMIPAEIPETPETAIRSEQRDPSTPLPPALFEEIVGLLAQALVADLKAFPKSTDVSRSGSDREAEPARRPS